MELQSIWVGDAVVFMSIVRDWTSAVKAIEPRNETVADGFATRFGSGNVFEWFQSDTTVEFRDPKLFWYPIVPFHRTIPKGPSYHSTKIHRTMKKPKTKTMPGQRRGVLLFIGTEGCP